ncbi:MAG: hypothetical protein J6X44_11890 [Thermoguttaceae bacterium]|nr:hypothetical protein [Thermoguttaceae bacterium]
MNNWNVNVDELVDKIMADLRASSSGDAARKTSEALSRDFRTLRAGDSRQNESRPSLSDRSVFSVSERVLVLDVVRRLAASVDAKRWSVPSGAVITPSAKDELNKLGVKLVVDARQVAVSTSASNVSRETAPTTASRASRTVSEKAPLPRVLAATHLPKEERFPVTVRDYLVRNAETTEIRLDCLKETTRRIAEELEKDKSLKVVLATHDAAIGSVWANRISGVRAVVAFSYEQAKRDLAATNANVAIVDPRDVGPYPFRQIVDYFLRR